LIHDDFGVARDQAMKSHHRNILVVDDDMSVSQICDNNPKVLPHAGSCCLIHISLELASNRMVILGQKN
jgi:hypothetical protein